MTQQARPVRHITLLFVTVLLFSCSQESSSNNGQASSDNIVQQTRNLDAEQIKRGRQLYLKNCTVCHGIYAEGAPDWQKRNPDGTFPAPPLNGTGHAWHHPPSLIYQYINEGSIDKTSPMPTFGDQLADDDIKAIIGYIQSLWPDEIMNNYKERFKGEKE